MSQSQLVIPLADYERIFRSVHGLMEAVDAHVPKACMFFAAAGALALNKYYGIPARMVAGSALYVVNEEDDKFVAVIGGKPGNLAFSDDRTFHCWVQTKDHVLDFMAPILREQVAGYQYANDIPRLAFQALQPDETPRMERNGDFDLFPNPELTDELVERMFGRNQDTDLLLTFDHWYQKPPISMLDPMLLGSNDGTVRPVRLSPLRISGTWGDRT